MKSTTEALFYNLLYISYLLLKVLLINHTELVDTFPSSNQIKFSVFFIRISCEEATFRLQLENVIVALRVDI